MKLFFSPGACSLAPHIALVESGLRHEVEKVDLRAKTCASGDFTKINPKGQVPALQLDDGDLMTENAVMLQYIADLVPEAGLLPKPGSKERWRALEWLNFIATELHKGFSPLFGKPSEEARKPIVERLNKKFAYLEQELRGREFLLGSKFSVADAYLFTVMSWARPLNVDLSAYPELLAFMERAKSRPSVQAALSSEGLGH